MLQHKREAYGLSIILGLISSIFPLLFLLLLTKIPEKTSYCDKYQLREEELQIADHDCKNRPYWNDSDVNDFILKVVPASILSALLLCLFPIVSMYLIEFKEKKRAQKEQIII